MLRTLLSKEIRETQRSRRLLIIVLVLIILGMLSPLFAKYTPLLFKIIPGVPPEMAALFPEPTVLDAFTQYVKNASQLGLIIVIVLNMGLVSQEVEHGTAAMLLTKPVLRSAFILCKWLASLLSILLGLALGAIAFTFYTIVLFNPFSLADFLAINGLILLFMSFYMTLALLASTLARSQAMAAAGAFGGLALVIIIDSLPRIGDLMPGNLLTWAGSIAAGNPQPDWKALLVCMGLCFIFLLAAIIHFERQEF